MKGSNFAEELKAMKIRVGIAGAAGYTGGELLRIAIHHPAMEIVFAHSKSNADKPIVAIHTDLVGDTDLVFADRFQFESIDALFLCMGHGESNVFMKEHSVPSHIKIIDLSQDFRPEIEGFVYGLPELKRDIIQKAQKVANPGCFATCIQLALLPLAKANLLKNDVHIAATTGSTGAGQSLSATSHFSWRNNNLSVYKAFEHQHLKEIKQSIFQLQTDFGNEIHFIPYRGDFTRGIMASLYIETPLEENDAIELYKTYYQSHPFTHVSDQNIDLKQVINTNKCLLHVEKHGRQLMILSIIDNLTKGASGQAVQNFNLMFGLNEKMGLGLKPVAF